MRVLLIEDDPMIAKGLQTALRQDGYAVDGVSDGRRAAEALRRKLGSESIRTLRGVGYFIPK
jgi:DNA-binding response OmpR family regulator